ncbi:hypothetical protein JCM3766R1_000408 [Sporobolomyces carnicolor]
MTEGSPAAVTARDRQTDDRFSTPLSGLAVREDRPELCDRQIRPAPSPSPRVHDGPPDRTSDPAHALGITPDSSDRQGSFIFSRFRTARSRPVLGLRFSPSTAHTASPLACGPDLERRPSHTVSESLAPVPIPTFPPAIEAMPIASALPPALAPPPSLHLASSTPPSPRMRRVSRRSPNARSERAAPSSIPTSDFSDLPTRSQGSLSSFPTSRHRAQSHSPAPLDAVNVASSARPTRRQLDPDQHWLSEDEATGSVGGPSGARQRTSGRRRGVQRGFGSDDEGASGRRKPRIDEIFASRLGRTSHEIHHRPANCTTLQTSSQPDQETDPTSFSTIVPHLVTLLTCPHCHDLLTNPVTFGCGHSRCKECPSTRKEESQLDGAVVTASPITPTPPPLTQLEVSLLADATKPKIAMIPGSFPDQLRLESSTSEPVAPKSTTAPTLPSCDIVNCRHAEFSPLPPVYASGPRTDYNLRKILDHLRKAMSESALVSLIDEPLDRERHDAGTSDTSVVDSKEKSVTRMPSDSSGSSGGGEEVTKGHDDPKRAHKHKSDFKPVKVAKKTRRMSESAVADDHAEEADSSDQDLEAIKARRECALAGIAATFFADVQSECDCQVCVQLLVEPITSPCGHSFCRNCLARAYDHSSKCPLCRSDLPPLPYFNRERTNLALEGVIETAFPTLAAERIASIREDELAHLANIPIFVCTTAWPGIPTFLHIFEPRYRLMMRRALESPTREFGMVLPSRDGSGGVNEYGTMLRITNCNVMEDGRSIVHSVGTWRFKIIERSMVDGYTVGRVERVEDVSLEQELELEQAALRSNDDVLAEYRDPEPVHEQGPSLTQRPSRPPMTGNMELPIDQLMQICFDFIRTLKSQSAPWVLQRLNNTVGEMPTTPAEFTWWCGEVMPVEDHVKVALLSITSVRERLRLIVFWIEQFRSSWWYSRGCQVM